MHWDGTLAVHGTEVNNQPTLIKRDYYGLSSGPVTKAFKSGRGGSERLGQRKRYVIEERSEKRDQLGM